MLQTVHGKGRRTGICSPVVRAGRIRRACVVTTSAAVARRCTARLYYAGRCAAQVVANGARGAPQKSQRRNRVAEMCSYVGRASSDPIDPSYSSLRHSSSSVCLSRTLFRVLSDFWLLVAYGPMILIRTGSHVATAPTRSRHSPHLSPMEPDGRTDGAQRNSYKPHLVRCRTCCRRTISQVYCFEHALPLKKPTGLRIRWRFKLGATRRDEGRLQLPG
jgi:hypothetical protein